MKKSALRSLSCEEMKRVVGGHSAPPCNGDGRDYAEHHIVPLATAGKLGNGGHKPGGHQGFSLCLGVHD